MESNRVCSEKNKKDNDGRNARFTNIKSNGTYIVH
jgi:hypothetical protein